MRYILFVLSICCTRCLPPVSTDTGEENPVLVSADRELEDKVPDIPMDSIVEANDPELLDLGQNQLFLDTTRSSSFFQQLQSWAPRIYHLETITFYQKRLKKRYSPPALRFPNFPKSFVRLHKSATHFVLYKPCRGMTTRYIIDEGLFLFYDSSGVIPKAIGKIIKSRPEEVKLTLWEDIWNDNSHSSSLTIHRSAEPFVYVLTYENEGKIQREWITPNEYIDKFDLIVNHCPVIQVPEYEASREEY